jgi:hypothetical protein
MRRQTPWRMGRREAVRLAAGKIESADSLRSFYLYVPGTYDQAAPAPLVLALHGHGTTGRNMEVLTHISRVADARGFIVAYPNGAHKGWNDGRPGVSENVDDVAFIRDLIVLLQSRYSIDPARIYALPAGLRAGKQHRGHRPGRGDHACGSAPLLPAGTARFRLPDPWYGRSLRSLERWNGRPGVAAAGNRAFCGSDHQVLGGSQRV